MSGGTRFGARGAAWVLCWLALATTPGGCATDPATSETPLTGEQVKELTVGNSFRGAWEAKQLTMVFYADGNLRGSLGLTGSDSGIWSVDGDTWCMQWIVYFGGVKRCYQWYPTSNGYLLRNVDAYRIRNITGRMEQGKPPGY